MPVSFWVSWKSPMSTKLTAFHRLSALTKSLPAVTPAVIDKKGAFEHLPEQYLRAGFARARVDGVVYALEEFPSLDKNYKHNIEVVVDRLGNDADSRTRLSQNGDK